MRGDVPDIPDEAEVRHIPHYLIWLRMSRNLIRICAVISALFLSFGLSAQTVRLVSWNVRSFEVGPSNSHTLVDDISDYIELLKSSGADIITLNEFEDATSRMERIRMSEIASALGMFAYYIESYPKDVGYYGNVILSKYPIIGSGTHKMTYQNAKGEGNYDQNSGEYLQKYGSDQRSVGYADILVPVSATESRVIRVVCSHFDHYVSPDAVRTMQAEESVEFASLDNPPYPAIMAGDLNTTTPETVIPAIWNAGDHIHANGLDHIFAFPKDAWTKSDVQTLSSGLLSDHNAVVATLTLNE